MNLINFTIDTSIEIGFGGRHRYLDLHNCFDWQSVDYHSERRCLKLSWIRSAGDWVSPDLPTVVELEFRGVSKFAAHPRNPALPYSEDSCLDFISFTPPEYAANFESECGSYRDAAEHLTFAFMSGLGLKIWADEVELTTRP